MNVSLTKERDKFVQEKVESGLYNSASEVVRESLRLLKQQEDRQSAWLEMLRREINAGLDQLDRGEGVASGDALE